MSHTISEKIIASAAGRKDVSPGETVYVKPELIMSYEWPGQDGLIRNIRIDPCRVALNLDHFFLAANEKEAKVHRNFRQTVEKYQIDQFFDVGRGGIGVHLMGEKGLVRPGMLVVHGDPHISTLGALGAYSVGIDGDTLSVFLTGEAWLKVPGTLKVHVEGDFPKGVTSRDLFEWIVRDLGPDGATGMVVEYDGPTIDAMSVDSREVLCNSVQYLSAETAIMNPDEKTIEYVKGNTDRDFRVVKSDKDAEFAQVKKYDVSGLVPQIVVPPDVFYVEDVADVEGTEISQALLGTCAGGRLEDLRLAAGILKGKKVHPRVRLIVTPISQKTYIDALREGLIETFVEAGAVVFSSSCSPCYGGIGHLLPGESCIATGTLNIPGRMGSTEANIYLGSTPTVAASAIEGKISDPRNFV